MAKRTAKVVVVDGADRIEVDIRLTTRSGAYCKDEIASVIRAAANNIADGLRGVPFVRVAADNTRVTV